MTIATFISITGLAVLDSINPTTLLIATYLLTKHKPINKILAYTAGIFTINFAVGILLLVGIGEIIYLFKAIFASPWVRAGELALGVTIFLSAFYTKPASKNAYLSYIHGNVSLLTLFGLGIGITVLEMSTAIPYFVAAGVITQANLTMPGWLGSLTVYNLVFILPPLAILIVYRLLRKQLHTHITRLRTKAIRWSQNAWPWILGILGFLIIRDAGGFFWNYFTR